MAKTSISTWQRRGSGEEYGGYIMRMAMLQREAIRIEQEGSESNRDVPSFWFHAWCMSSNISLLMISERLPSNMFSVGLELRFTRESLLQIRACSRKYTM